MARGKRTARSQQHRHDALAQYGYPSDRHLRREAKNIARASAPTVRSIERPFNRQTQSAKDFMAAVMGAMQQTSGGVGSAYDAALAQQQAVTQAAQTRLGGLGLGDTGAGVQAATGALGDSATSQLISNAASAKTYAAQLPGIAAGSAQVGIEGIRKQLQDALQNRRDEVRQSFFPALSQVQGQALQRAGFNQAESQFQQNMSLQRAQMAQQASQFQQTYAEGRREFGISHAEQMREFNISAKAKRQSAAAAGISASEWRQEAGIVADYAGKKGETTKVPTYTTQKDPETGKKIRVTTGYKQVPVKGSRQPNIVGRGVPFATAVQTLLAKGVKMPVIQSMLIPLYERAATAPNGTYDFDAYWSYREFMSNVDPYTVVGGSQPAHRHR